MTQKKLTPDTYSSSMKSI